MKKKIHINQHNIRSNKKYGTNLPVITVKTYKENIYCEQVNILGPSVLMYRPDKPLPCGARCWLETDAEVEMIGATKLNKACDSATGSKTKSKAKMRCSCKPTKAA